MDLIVCDIDNTVSDQYSRYFEYYDFNKSKLSEMAFNSDIISKDRPLLGAQLAVEILSKKYQIVWLSARPRDYFQLTKDWLIKWDFPCDTIILTGNHSQGIDKSQGNHFRKIDILKGLRPKVYIDDLKCCWEKLQPVKFVAMIDGLYEAGINFEIFNNNWPLIVKKYYHVGEY